MITNKNLHPQARARHARSRLIDMSSDTRQSTAVVLSQSSDVRICRADIVFTADGDTNAVQPVTIGVQGALTRYANHSHNVVAATNQEGDVEAVTMTNLTILVPKGTAVLIRRAAGASTNTSELMVILEYELVDKL